MREIKFRAWDSYHKQMFQIHSLGSVDSTTDILKFGDGTPLMQYTGLKDNNGETEVYESDIGEIGEYICKLIWDELNAQFRWIDIETGQWILGSPSDAKVIGNIYENPELLGGNNG